MTDWKPTFKHGEYNPRCSHVFGIDECKKTSILDSCPDCNACVFKHMTLEEI